MALWPFRRRSGRKRSRSGAAFSDVEGAPPPRSQTEGVVTRAASKKKQRTEPMKLQRRTRTYSFSPGRYDDIRVDRHRDRDRAGTAARERTGRTGNPSNDGEQPWAWDRTPTLHHKPSSHHPARRKSSKRRREEHDREAEIKAMSNFMPVRPATEQWNAGRPMKKDSKRVKTMGFGKHRDNAASEVSLPVPDSIHSSLSSDSEFGSYRVSALDALAPRPTLRYAHGPRALNSHTSIPNRAVSQRRRFTDRGPIPQETLIANRRIDDLADGLDSSDLRELMERDNRRREKKRQKEQERTERRLTRRAEKQRTQELEAKTSGTPPPENLERGVMGRELVGLGIEPKSAVVTSSKQRSSVESIPMPDADIAEDSSKQPLEIFHRTDTAPLEEPTTVEAPMVVVQESVAVESPIAVEEPTTLPEPMAVEEVSKQESIPAESVRKSDEQASMSTGTKFSGLLKSVKSRSKSSLGSDRDKMASPPPVTINEDDVLRKDSESSTRGRFSFSNFMRWGGKSHRNSGPSSFSNTSREEMQAAAAARAAAEAHSQALARLQGEDTPTPPEGFSGHYMARKADAPPKRTRSRFREDLPEFPLSPPASRVQSPDAEPPLPALSEHMRREMESVRPPGARYDTPTSGHRSIEAKRQTPTSMEGAYISPSPEPHLSISLASIDSEASWLSGKPNARKAAMRESLIRANRREQGESSSGSPTNSTQEDLAITEDDYLSKLTPRRDSTHALGRRSGEGRPSSDEEDLGDDGDVKWGTAASSHPQFVRTHNHDRFTMKSQEGLLDIESEIEEDIESSPVSPTPSEMVDVQRARSVNLSRGHIRNFSAGSAKLLDITPRASVDDRRRSGSRRSSAVVIV